MSKRELKPNYQMLFDSAVHGLQIAYNEYKKLLFEDLKLTWYNDEGNFCFFGDAKARKERIANAEKDVKYMKKEVEKYRRLSGDDSEIN